jgi:hypothetical protein
MLVLSPEFCKLSASSFSSLSWYLMQIFALGHQRKEMSVLGLNDELFCNLILQFPPDEYMHYIFTVDFPLEMSNKVCS